MTESPAETIRRAAALMRERAEAATAGPWSTATGTWMGAAFPSVLGADGDPEDPSTWLMATSNEGERREANAAHAASWHPLVALAVADWLDSEYRRARADGGIEMVPNPPYKVACAYLGEPEVKP